jgi:hypothetical protein
MGQRSYYQTSGWTEEAGMQSKILHLPTGTVLDLAQPDLGHPDGQAIIEAHYHDCHRDRPAFVCVKHLGGTNPGMYLKKIQGAWWAVHFEVGRCQNRRLPAPMSDEHKRQAEYWVRAAEDAGWRAEMERTLPTGTRPDVLIHGPVVTGIEVQRAAMTRAGAVQRTKKAALAGVCDVWFTDKEAYPRWVFRVPTVGQQPQAWQYLPPRRAVLANGLRAFNAVRCQPGNLLTCLNGGGWCGRYHPKVEPRVVVLDEVASRVPAGEIVALRIGAMSGVRGGVYLFPAESAALYRELTGKSAELAFDPRAEDRRRREPDGRVECRNVQAPASSAFGVSCGACGRGFVSERAFRNHQVSGWDGRPVCPESAARFPLPSRQRG